MRDPRDREVRFNLHNLRQALRNQEIIKHPALSLVTGVFSIARNQYTQTKLGDPGNRGEDLRRHLPVSANDRWSLKVRNNLKNLVQHIQIKLAQFLVRHEVSSDD